MVEVVIFAMIAAFLGFRLYAVLGKRTGHEQSWETPTDDVKVPAKKAELLEDSRDVARVAPAPEPETLDDNVVRGVRAISAADSSFHAGEFMAGAEHAYRIVLEAFWQGDLETLESLTSPDVYEAFSEAVAARKAKGEVLENRLVRIERAMISDATLQGKLARITVQFDADVAAVTRNKKGAVVAGSLSDAVPTHDVWTFERTIKSANPNWTLVDTDEAD